MTIALTSPVTGAAQTGFTTPTYTVVADSATDFNGKKYAVTAIGGTQAGVFVHSISNPFSVLFYKPKIFKILGKVLALTGLLPSVPKNTWGILTQKGCIPLAGQPASIMTIRTTVDVPAGADAADLPNIRAALALHIGALTQQSAGIGDSLGSGTF